MNVARPREVTELGLSKLGAVRLLRRDPIALLERAAAIGDLTHTVMPRTDVYFVNHPDDVWDVLATGNHDFHKSPALQNARRVLGDGLLTSEDETHRRQRRLIQPIFHHERINAYGDPMVAEAERAADRWADGSALDLHAEMARLTLAIVGRTLFATDVESAEAREVTGALHEILSQFGRQFSPWFPITERLPLPARRRFDRAVAVFDRLISSLIAERRATGPRDDLLSLLLAAQEDGAGMTDTQVRDEAVTLFLAGHETTSNALTWTWWQLSRHPEVEARVHAELDEVLGNVRPTPATWARIAVPACGPGRIDPASPSGLGDGPQVMAPTRSPGSRCPRVRSWWSRRGCFTTTSDGGRRPDVRPGSMARARPGRPRHAYLPFGGGPRMCIGEGFAWMEADWSWPRSRNGGGSAGGVPPVELQPVITLRPRYGMPMRVYRRERP